MTLFIALGVLVATVTTLLLRQFASGELAASSDAEALPTLDEFDARKAA